MKLIQLSITVLCLLLLISFKMSFGQNNNPPFNQLQQQEISDLNDARTQGEEEYRHAANDWIPPMESWVKSYLSGGPKDSSELINAILELNKLYEITNRHEQAFSLYHMLATSPQLDDSIRVMAADKAAKSAARKGGTADEILQMTNLFASLVKRGYQNYAQDDLTMANYENINFYRADLLFQAAQHLTQNKTQTPSTSYQIIRKAGALYRQSAHFMQLQLKESNPNAIPYFSQYANSKAQQFEFLGIINSTAAHVYEQADEKNNARPFHIAAVQAFENIFQSPYYEDAIRNQPYLTQEVSQMLLKEKFFVTDSVDSYVAYAYEIAKKVAPVTESLAGFIEVQGMDLSSQASVIGINTDEGKRLLDAANALYDLAMKLDQQYKPEEYKHLPNFQSAALFAADNADRLGQYDQVEYYLSILKGIEVKGSVTGSIRSRLTKKMDAINLSNMNETITPDASEKNGTPLREMVNTSTNPKPPDGETPSKPIKFQTAPSNINNNNETSSQVNSTWLIPTGIVTGIIFLIISILIIRKSKFA